MEEIRTMANFSEKLSNIGSKAKQGAINIGTSIEQKTNTFTEKVSLNNKIDSAKREIKQTCTDLGEKFYLQNSKNEIPQGYEIYFNKIKECNKKIEDAQNAIKELDGLIKCPNCGADIKKENAFCTSCGAKLAEEKKSETSEDVIICKTCAKEISASSIFCPNCGTKVEAKEDQTANEETQKENICPNCGNKINPDAVFCTQCGFHLKQE